MTIVQTYHCQSCDYRFGPVGVQPFMPDRPQVFRYCHDCSRGQALIVQDASKPLECVHCRSTHLSDVQEKCPVCGSKDVGWESRL